MEVFLLHKRKSMVRPLNRHYLSVYEYYYKKTQSQKKNHFLLMWFCDSSKELGHYREDRRSCNGLDLG